MSEIFLAYQRGIGGFRKIVALKTILPDTRGHEDVVRMFLNEARVTAEFSHPNIVQVYDLGIDNDMLFLAMEYVQGCNVVEMVRACHSAKQSIPMGFSLAVARDTALALSYAHSFVDMRHRKRPIVHSDVAGKNIMVSYDGTTKLLDFGIAKMQDTSPQAFSGVIKGTKGYMSPEQLLGLPLDGRSDIFSLGIVIHECLTGFRLFHESSSEKKKTSILNRPIPLPSSLNPKIPSPLDSVVMKALEKNPYARFQSALEFARALENAAGEHIWRAEQVGELVSQHFSQRREQTRELIEEVQARLNDVTGQIQLEGFFNKNTLEEAALLENNPLEENIPPPPETADNSAPPAFVSTTDENTLTLLSPEQLQAESPPSPPPPLAVHSENNPGRSALVPIPYPPLEKNTQAPPSGEAEYKTNPLYALLANKRFVFVLAALLSLGSLLSLVLLLI